MSDDMLICFDSPAAVKTQGKMSNRNGLSSPLIPCPSTPFDLVSSCPSGDPFDLEPQDPYGVNCRVRHRTRTPERSLLPPTSLIDIPAVDVATPSPLLLRRVMSDVDISGVVPGQFLVSSTPLVSNSNTPTRSSLAAPRRSVLNIDECISSDLVKSKLDFINKVNRNIALGGGNLSMCRSKSISNLPEACDSSVQHKIFSSSKPVVSQEQRDVIRGNLSANTSLPLNHTKANCSSFVFDQEEVAKHETSAYLSFLTSPKTTVVGLLQVVANPSPQELRVQAKKLEVLFSLCAADDCKVGENEDCVWINSSCLPDAWFDESLDFDNIHTNSDSDEERSAKDELEAFKVRLNRFRLSVEPEKDQPVKERIENDPIEKGVATSVVQPKTNVEVEAQPVVPSAVVPKMPLVQEVKLKTTNSAPTKKGPLKAVEPVPNMIKKSSSSDLLLKSKPALVRGRPSRPSSAQSSRRPSTSTSRRSNSISPNRTAPLPAKNPRPPVKLSGVKTKANPVAGKGKENRV